jgi:hypothetical protein
MNKKRLTQVGKPLSNFAWYAANFHEKHPKRAYVVLVTITSGSYKASNNGKMTITEKTVVYGTDQEKCLKVAHADMHARVAYFKEHHMVVPDYRVLTAEGLKRLETAKEKVTAERRKGAGKRAAATRKRRGTKPEFTLCHCGAKSKLLYSEMGGLQTRRCQKGHVFEYDKWIADRAPVAIAFGANPLKVVEGMRPRPKKGLY